MHLPDVAPDAPTILVVEDHEDTRALLSSLLESEGYAVLTADSGEAAMALLANAPAVDLIILDLNLPGISGYDVVERLRAADEQHPVPVLVLSSRSGVQDRIRGLRDGADGYLTKPFLPEEVATAARGLVTRHLLAQRNRDMSALEQVAELALRTPKGQDLLEHLPALLLETFRADVAVVFMLEPDGAARARFGRGAALDSGRTQSTVVAQVVATGTPVFVADVAGTQGVRAPHEAGLRMMVAAPLKAGGRVLGVLQVGTRRRPLDSRAARLVALLADRVAVALEYARLQAETRDLADVTRSIGEGVLVLDAQDQITFANDAFARMVGRAPDLLTGGLWTQFLSPAQDRGAVLARLHQPTFQGELLLLRSGADPVPVLTTITTHEGEHGRRRIGVFRDISREHEQRFQVIREQKLRTLGSLAAGVAHNINNRLTPVIGWTDLLLEQLDHGVVPSAQELLHAIRIIRHGTADSVATVRRLQDYARPAGLRGPEVVALRDVVEQLLALVRPQWDTDAARRGVRYTVSVQEHHAHHVLAIPSELREAILNVLENAVHAMPGGGTLTVTLGGSGKNAELTVKDSGVGMTDDVKRLAFEPFFTTRQTTGGMGLGLTLVQETITRAGGTVTLVSSPGEGTTVTITLPGVERPNAAAPTVINKAPAQHILIVDDEPAVLGVLRAMLQSLGHTVVSAASGEEALKALDSAAVDLILTDLGMPGMTGLAVAAEVSRRRPGTPVVLATGWGNDVGEEEMRAAGVLFTISKPLSREALRQAVARAVAPRPPA